MTAHVVQLDAQKRSVTAGGRTAELREKSWCVLAMLIERAPQVVTRGEFIDSIWQGNYLTGERGLNQALWTIRAALGDDARCPRFIRTIPRVGYQWVHVETPAADAGRVPRNWRMVARAAGILVVFGVAAALSYLPRAGTAGAEFAPAASASFGTHAYRVNRDVFVDMSDGCRRILKNADNVEIGQPVLSSDGSRVAVAVHRASGCRLVTVELLSGRKHNFGGCPAEST